MAKYPLTSVPYVSYVNFLHALIIYQNTHILNSEPAFLPHLIKLHTTFPNLRIVLEHATTREAVNCVKSLGATVACTITAHHLVLTVDDWAGQSWNYCKPVAKYPDDREALREVVKEGVIYSAVFLHSDRIMPGHPRFFLGSDSAPHSLHTKSTARPNQGCAAGIYTSPILLPLIAHLLEDFGALDKLEGFVSTFGREFYRVEVGLGDEGGRTARKVELRRTKKTVEGQEGSVVPFWSGREIGWEVVDEASVS
jgi:dihydroorotase